MSHSQKSQHHFLAICGAKAFTKGNCDNWTYYRPKERDRCKRDLFSVLLVELTSSIISGGASLREVVFLDAECTERMLACMTYMHATHGKIHEGA